MEILSTSCRRAPALSRSEALRYAALAVGTTLAAALPAAGLTLVLGASVWSEALALSSASIAPLVYGLTFLREHPLRTRATLGIALFALVYAITLISVWL